MGRRVAPATMETDVGTLPADWTVLRFGDVVEIKSGQVDPREEPYGKMVHVGPENVAEGAGTLLPCKTAEELNLISGKYLFTPHDVVYSKIRPYLRKVVLPDFTGVCSADMYPLRPKSELLAREYLYVWLLSDVFTRQAVSFQDRTGIPKINRQQLEATIVSLPPLSEQRAIALVLRTVQRAKQATEKVLSATKQLKQSLLRHLFTYGPVPFDQADKVELKETEIGPVPEHWKVVKFGEAVEIGSGQVDPKEEPYASMLHIGPENIEGGTGRILSPKLAKEIGLISGKYLFGSEQVLYSKIRPYLRKTALPGFRGICSADMYALRAKDNISIRNFLHLWLLTDTFTRQAVSHQSRTGIPKINRTQLDSTLLPIPPLEEQNSVASLILSVGRKIESEQARHHALTVLFTTLLHHLMTGKMRVNEWRLSESAEDSP